jgi:hypothetical protein
MIRLPLTITFRLDEATRAKIRERIGPDRSLRTVSQLIREGINLRLEHNDWGVKR